MPSGLTAWKTTSLVLFCSSLVSVVLADIPVGGAGVLAGEVTREIPVDFGVEPSLPSSVHFGKCLDLVELMDGTRIMMVGAPDDDDGGRLWSQGNASGSVFVYRQELFWSLICLT